MGYSVGSGPMSRDPVFTYGPRKVACGGRGFDESIIGLFFDLTKKKGNARPEPAKINKPVATKALRALDMCLAQNC